MPGEPRRRQQTNASRPRIPNLLLPLALLLPVLHVAGAHAANLRSVTVSPSPVQLQIGQARQLRAFANYSDGSVQEITQTAEWTTGSSRIAIVSKTPGSVGVVTAIAPGTVKINAALVVGTKKEKGFSELTVLAPPLVSLTTRPTTKKLEIGIPKEFKATALYANEFTEDVTDRVNWSSTNPAVATVDNSGPTKGTVRPVGIGTTEIIARDPQSGMQNGDGATQVRSAVTSLEVEPASLVTARRVRVPFRCYGLRDDGSRSNLSTDVDWGSTNPGVATVGVGEFEGGLVRGVADGTAEIHCADPERGLSTVIQGGGASVTVGGRLVSLEVRSLSLAVGEEKGARVIGKLHNGLQTGDLADAVNWAIDGPDIATVTNDPSDRGNVVGHQRGTTTLRALEPITQISSKGANNLKVLGALQSVTMEDGGGIVGLGETAEFKARATFEGNESSNFSDKCEWSSDAPRTAQVSDTSPSKGVVTGVRRGTTTIRANCQGRIISAAVQVIGNLQQLAVSPTSYEDEALTEKKFRAIGKYDDGNERDLTKLVTWSSSAPTIVSIDTSDDVGLAKLLQPGPATLTAKHPTKPFMASATVLVQPGIIGLEVVPRAKTVRGSMHVRYRAQGRRANGTIKVVTKDAVWSVDDPAVARVSPNEPGTVFGGGHEGVTLVRATLPGGFTATSPLTVQGLLTSFELIPKTRTIPLLQARIVEARARFTDGGSRKINRGAIYTSSDTNVAIVSNEPGSHGVVTAVGRGTATISGFDPSSGKTADNVVEVTVP